jgi:bacteriocin-like protein
MANTDKTAEKVDAGKTTETTLEQEELSAEELSKISGGDIYTKPLTQKGIN